MTAPQLCVASTASAPAAGPGKHRPPKQAFGGPARCDGREWGALSNLALCQIYIDGQRWVSVEQYFQAQRSRDIDYQDALLRLTADVGDSSRFAAQSHGAEVWRLSQSVAQCDDFRSLETMYVATMTKFEQSYIFRDDLLRTRGEIRAAPNSGDWQRLHSLILERVREELRDDDARDEERLRDLRNIFARESFQEEFVVARLKEIREAHNALGRQYDLNAMTLDGRGIRIRACGTETVLDVKNQLAQTSGVASSRIELILGDVSLRDVQTISELGITDDVVLNIVIRSPIPLAARKSQTVDKADAHANLMDAIRVRAGA